LVRVNTPGVGRGIQGGKRGVFESIKKKKWKNIFGARN